MYAASCVLSLQLCQIYEQLDKSYEQLASTTSTADGEISLMHA